MSDELQIDTELELDLSAVLDALEADPRFEALIRRINLKTGRRTGNIYGPYAQQQGQQGPTQRRIS